MAEFVKVAKEYNRICDSYECGNDCPLNKVRDKAVVCRYWTLLVNPEKAEEVVMKWAKEHPAKTNAKKFIEVFGFPISQKFPVSEYDSEWLNKEYKEPKDD